MPAPRDSELCLPHQFLTQLPLVIITGTGMPALSPSRTSAPPRIPHFYSASRIPCRFRLSVASAWRGVGSISTDTCHLIHRCVVSRVCNSCCCNRRRHLSRPRGSLHMQGQGQRRAQSPAAAAPYCPLAKRICPAPALLVQPCLHKCMVSAHQLHTHEPVGSDSTSTRPRPTEAAAPQGLRHAENQ